MNGVQTFYIWPSVGGYPRSQSILGRYSRASQVQSPLRLIYRLKDDPDQSYLVWKIFLFIISSFQYTEINFALGKGGSSYNRASPLPISPHTFPQVCSRPYLKIPLLQLYAALNSFYSSPLFGLYSGPSISYRIIHCHILGPCCVQRRYLI